MPNYSDLITPENVRAYAKAGKDLYETCEALALDGHSFCVVPSRGAVPFHRIAEQYFFSVVRLKPPEVNQHIQALNEYSSNPIANAVYMPFTAEVADDSLLSSAMVRAHWVGVLSDLVRGRTSSARWRFYEFLRRSVFVSPPKDTVEERANSEKFVFLDTVVSGRSFYEIATAFENEHLNDVHFVLFVDQNGARIARRYQSTIDKYVNAGRATIINLPDLITEDRGPSVSGIWSVVVPALMEVALQEVPEFSELGTSGAGFYWLEIALRSDKTNLGVGGRQGHFHSMIYSVFSDELHEGFRRRPHILEHHAETYAEDEKGWPRLDRQDVTLEIARPVLSKIAKVRYTTDVSNSHVIRANIDTDEAARLVREFKR